MKKIAINNKENTYKILKQCKNYLMNFSNRLTIMISNTLRNINNKLKNYSELKNKYNIPNTGERQFAYAMVARNGLDNSIINY